MPRRPKAEIRYLRGRVFALEHNRKLILNERHPKVAAIQIDEIDKKVKAIQSRMKYLQKLVTG